MYRNDQKKIAIVVKSHLVFTSFRKNSHTRSSIIRDMHAYCVAKEEFSIAFHPHSEFLPISFTFQEVLALNMAAFMDSMLEFLNVTKILNFQLLVANLVGFDNT